MDTSKPNTERSATDDRIDENREPAVVAPATRDPDQSEEGGLPLGQSDSRESPLDTGFFDPNKRSKP